MYLRFPHANSTWFNQDKLPKIIGVLCMVMVVIALHYALLIGTPLYAGASDPLPLDEVEPWSGHLGEDADCQLGMGEEPLDTAFFVITRTEQNAIVGRGGFRTREDAEAVVSRVIEVTQSFNERVGQGETEFEVIVVEASGSNSALLQVTGISPPPEILEQMLQRDRDEQSILGGLSACATPVASPPTP